MPSARSRPLGTDVLQTRGRGYLLAAEPADLIAFRSDLTAAHPAEQAEHTDDIAELQTLSAHEPLRESLTALLMTALYRAGRQSKALTTYDAFTEWLVDEFGLDPTDDLRALRQSVLTSSLDAAHADRQRQNQLPRNLVGRTELVRDVADLLTAADGVRIVALSGTPGVGKTSLAVRVTHELTTLYPGRPVVSSTPTARRTGRGARTTYSSNAHPA